MEEQSFLDELEEQKGDIYELTRVASMRAKQINKLRQAKYPMPNNEDEYEEVAFDEDEVDWSNMEKPYTSAIKELINGDSDYELRNTGE